MNQQDTVRGIVKSIVYKNESDGFIICSVSVSEKQIETVRGYLVHLVKGEEIIAYGMWEIHKKFGKQFVASSVQKVVPHTKEGLVAYLGSGLIKGIGPIYAQKLVEKFGDTILEIIEHNPERLLLIPGIGKTKVDLICTSFYAQKEMSEIMLFLQERGVSTAYAIKIFKQYKQNAISVIQENPYRLAEDIWGIGFKVADDIAKKLGIVSDSPLRISAGILYSLSMIHGQGSVYYDFDSLHTQVAELLSLTQDELLPHLETALILLKNQGKIKSILKSEKEFLTTAFLYFAEKELSDQLRVLGSSTKKNRSHLTIIKNTASIHTLAEKQIDGLQMALSSGVSIVTGGPGTGKTTLIKALLAHLDHYGLSSILAAPTGRAAKRMKESSGYNAVTIHRLLEFDPMTRKFQKNHTSPLETDFVIVDEASMIDLVLAHSLVKAISPGTQLLFIGDIDQLPSVGVGNVLADMIESGVIPCTRLTTIFRQSEQSMIVLNAHRINDGKFPLVAAQKEKAEFIYIEETDASRLSEHLKSIFDTTLPFYEIPNDQVIVLCPMHRGLAGTGTVNMFLQSLLNPDEGEKMISSFGTVFKKGDRVMQLRNNYDKSVFNGDTGIIDVIDRESGEMCVRFLDRVVKYEQHDIQELTLAYAISIHKSQGSEYQAVIVPLFMQHFMMLQKNLLYTAMTRAKKLCIFVGEKKAISIGLKKGQSAKRITFLREYLSS